MAKMTLADLQSFCKDYVAAAKQAGTWTASTDNLYGLIDKIGLMINLDGVFQDKLPELDGEDLPLGKTIEEYFIDLILPQAFDSTGAGALSPSLPDVEEPAYSYTLGRKKIKTTEPYNNVERAALTANDASNMTAKIVERLYNSYSLYKYQIKKQLLGNVAAKAEAATNAATLVESITVPSDTASAEAFIKKIKEDVETASFANEGHNLGNCLIGASPSLKLYVKKGIMPTVEVDALAGAFNENRMALPAEVKVIDDFGDQSGVVAMLIDPRGVKLHRGYHAVRTQENADGDFINFFDHSEHTGFISKFTFVKIYKSQE